jgi:hypothetical protein
MFIDRGYIEIRAPFGRAGNSELEGSWFSALPNGAKRD